MLKITVDPLHPLIGEIVVENESLINSINAMPEEEYLEVVKGVLSKDTLTTDKLMVITAYCWKLLQTKQLNPAQVNTLNAFIEQLQPIQI